METVFTPVQSLSGGALIGLAAVALMLLRGRILGATGILAGALLPASRYDWTWRVMMLVGLFAGLSPRSFAATGTFMLTTGLTVYVMRHILGA